MNRFRSTLRPRLRWGAVAAWALVVAALLWTPGSDQPPPWLWLEVFERLGGDKLVHAVLFGVQAWLLCRCRPGRAALPWLAACLGLTVAYGVATEIGQLAVAGRGADVADALADATGASLAVVLFGLRSR